ncbi:acyl carrier protein [Methylobacter tundripaludum]|uniref:Carrier domain-containing protein n=1 Tax=Methylobacter tundripaludum (strain ATCC BAA-1195 / DSM 17260 / SV96) TaxID=697282 RepID=G3IU43_METTV|nr:acyl carrier protein [Methylobacter tundripaludum]EGW22641.1 hypothetical protein Mettu_1457 [Methylobacter tundripaludum SV96]
MEIEKNLLNALRQSMPKPIADRVIEADSNLSFDLGIDSLGLMTLSVNIENAYAINLVDHVEALMTVKSVSELQTLIHSVL